jgi:WD40 repeat protein
MPEPLPENVEPPSGDASAQPTIQVGPGVPASDPNPSEATQPSSQPIKPAIDLKNAPLYRLGDYELMAEIGRGGMGVVFRARHVRLNRVVALKMILGGLLARADDLLRFDTEIAAAAQLQHPGIVALYEAGTHDNQPFFSMEYVPGSSLAQRVVPGPLPPRTAAVYLEKTARAVHYAHTRGVVHRDLKPANVLLDEQDQPKITDFGLAKLLQTESGQTRTGHVIGTPSYMAPEQAAARKDLSAACDIYSLGAILYELLTGKPPFRGDTALATLNMVNEEEPVPPRLLNRKIEPDLETICLKCLEKEPGRRYASAEDLANDLRCYLDGEPIAARRLGRLGRALKWCRRKPAAAALLLMSAVAVAALLGGALALAYVQHQNMLAERSLRQEAEQAQRLADDRLSTTERLLYLAQIRQADHAIETADLDRAQRLLSRWRPRPGEARLVDWEWYYLQGLLRGRSTLTGHSGRVTAVAFHPKSDRLASAGGEPIRAGEIILWDSQTGKPLRTLKGHTNKIGGLAFSPDGKYLASASDDHTIKIWDAETGAELHTLREHTKHVNTVAFSADGRFLASAGGEPAIRVWNIAHIATPAWKATCITLEGHKGEVGAVAFHPTQPLLSSASRDTTVKLWDPITGQELRNLVGHSGEAASVAFSGDGTLLASAGGRGAKAGEVKLWESATGQLHFAHDNLSHRILSVAFGPGDTLAAAGSDGLVRIWDHPVANEAIRVRGDTQIVFAVAFDRYGRLATAGRDGRVRLWNSDGGQESLLLPADPKTECVTVSGDGQWIAYAGRFGKQGDAVRLWNVANRKPLAPLRGHAGGVRCLAFGPSSERLATVDGQGALRLFDLRQPEKPLFTQETGTEVVTVAFCPTGARLATAGTDTIIKLWDASSGKFERDLHGHGNDIAALAFSHDGALLASGGSDKSVRVWTIATGAGYELIGQKGSIKSLAFHPRGGQLATGSVDKSIWVWDLTKRQKLWQLDGSTAVVTALAYHPNGQRLASTGQDKVVRLWDLVTWQEILQIEGSPTALNYVSFSRDGRRLASAGPAAPIRVWEALP